MATTRQTSIEDFEQLSDVYARHELIDGELRDVAPPGEDHSDVVRELTWSLEQHLRATGAEKLFIEAAFVLRRDPDTVLIPDVAFLREERLDPSRDTSKSVGLAPDLAVEVISPTDRVGEIGDKVQTYLDAGVEMVWLLDPRQRTVTVHRCGEPPKMLSGGDLLEGGDVLPGLAIPVGAIFRR